MSYVSYGKMKFIQVFLDLWNFNFSTNFECGNYYIYLDLLMLIILLLFHSLDFRCYVRMIICIRCFAPKITFLFVNRCLISNSSKNEKKMANPLKSCKFCEIFFQIFHFAQYFHFIDTWHFEE